MMFESSVLAYLLQFLSVLVRLEPAFPTEVATAYNNLVTFGRQCFLDAAGLGFILLLLP